MSTVAGEAALCHRRWRLTPRRRGPARRPRAARGHRARVPWPESRGTAPCGAGGAGARRRDRGDSELHRRIRHRLHAAAAGALHEERRRGPAALKVLASGSSQMAGAAPERDPPRSPTAPRRRRPRDPRGSRRRRGRGHARLQAMADEMMNGFEIMERDRQGYIATDALSAMVHTMGRLPDARASCCSRRASSCRPPSIGSFSG